MEAFTWAKAVRSVVLICRQQHTNMAAVQVRACSRKLQKITVLTELQAFLLRGPPN